MEGNNNSVKSLEELRKEFELLNDEQKKNAVGGNKGNSSSNLIGGFSGNMPQ